jgi:HPt (histidine-containing phosphotransfer) domain-containing protein
MTAIEIDMAAFDTLKQMSGADFIGELIDAFLDDAPQLIQQMKTALKAGDAETFRRAAHSLKSNGATFGANNVSALARELEMLGRENQLAQTGGRLDALEAAYQKAAGELKELRK